VDHPIPGWGLYRVLKALEGRAVTGVLELKLEGGDVSLRLADGHVVAANTTMAGLSFSRYLARTGLAPEGLPPERRIATSRDLVDAGAARYDEAAKRQSSHARSVLTAILPLAFASWTFRPGAAADWALDGPPVEVTPELMRAVSCVPDVVGMRAAVLQFRAGGWISLASGAEGLLSDAKSLIGDAKVLYLLRQGRSSEVGEGVASEDLSARVLFALVVAGALQRDPAGMVEAEPATAAAGPASEAAPAVTGGGGEGPDAGDAPAAEEARSPDSQVVAELRQAANAFGTATLYEVLGVGTDGRLSEVESAYARGRRRYARARYEGEASGDVSRLLDVIHCRLDEARATLTDRTLRLSYNRSIGIATPGLEARIVEMFEARQHYGAGLELAGVHKPDEALAEFEAAATQDPREPEYAVAIARHLLARGPLSDSIARARSLLEEALRIDPDLVPAMIGMATVCRIERQREAAVEHLRAALRIDPENAEALAMKGLLQGTAPASKMVFKKQQESVFDRLKRILKTGS
jgi:tetratricopeptide (TPR) repeat protein